MQPTRSNIRIDLSHLPWSSDTMAELRIVDAAHNFDVVRTETIGSQNPSTLIRLPKPATALLQLRPATATTDNRLTIVS